MAVDQPAAVEAVAESATNRSLVLFFFSFLLLFLLSLFLLFPAASFVAGASGVAVALVPTDNGAGLVKVQSMVRTFSQ